MKVQELRSLLASAERGNLEKAFMECYRQLRKAQKEECDPLVVALLEGKAAEQTKIDTSVDFETLTQQIKLSTFKKYDSKRHALEDTINELSGMIFLITVKLGEPEQGIKYFFSHSQKRSDEITLYCALQLAGWMDVYKYGLSKKIRPRDSLQKEYEKRQKR